MAANIFPAVVTNPDFRNMATTDSRLERFHRLFHAANPPRNLPVEDIILFLDGLVRTWEGQLQSILSGDLQISNRMQARRGTLPQALRSLSFPLLPEGASLPHLAMAAGPMRNMVFRFRTTECYFVEQNAFPNGDDRSGTNRVVVIPYFFLF